MAHLQSAPNSVLAALQAKQLQQLQQGLDQREAQQTSALANADCH